jgi:hypothetical protein
MKTFVAALVSLVTFSFAPAFAQGLSKQDAVERAYELVSSQYMPQSDVGSVEIANCGTKWAEKIAFDSMTEELETFEIGIRIGFTDSSALSAFAADSAQSPLVINLGGHSIPVCAKQVGSRLE